MLKNGFNIAYYHKNGIPFQNASIERYRLINKFKFMKFIIFRSNRKTWLSKARRSLKES